MKLAEIVWPVFRLGEYKPICEGNVVYFRSDYADREDATLHSRIRLVDNRDIDKPTLGRRRLELQANSVLLSYIGKALYFISDLVKLAKSTTWFIDTAGNVFQHKKSQRAKLLCKKITQQLPTTGLGTIIEVAGIASRFKTAYKPLPEQTYAGVLQIGISYVFYGFYTQPFKDSWRII